MSEKFGRVDALSTPIFWNMLTVAPDVVGQGTWVRAVNSSFLYGGQFYNTTSADGDEFSVNFRCPVGTYTIRFSAIKDSDRGIVDTYVDASEEDSIDLYAAAADYLNVVEITGVSITAGSHTLKFVVDGKNGSSSDYFLNVNGISLQRTA